MKFDVFAGFSRIDPSKPDQQVYLDTLEQVKLCDDIGINTVWFPEHHFIQVFNTPAPLISIADAAHRTRNVGLGTAVIITPYHHPLIVAEQVALVDQLTQ